MHICLSFVGSIMSICFRAHPYLRDVLLSITGMTWSLTSNTIIIIFCIIWRRQFYNSLMLQIITLIPTFLIWIKMKLWAKRLIPAKNLHVNCKSVWPKIITKKLSAKSTLRDWPSAATFGRRNHLKFVLEYLMKATILRNPQNDLQHY